MLVLLVNAAAMLAGTGVAMRLRTMQAAPAIRVPFFLLLFVAPVWVPYDLLTGWVRTAAAFNPITLVLEANHGLPQQAIGEGAARLPGGAGAHLRQPAGGHAAGWPAPTDG